MANSSFYKTTGTSSTLQTSFGQSVEQAEASAAAAAASATQSSDSADASAASAGTATAQSNEASDHRADAAKYATTGHNTTFALTGTNGGTTGLYSALHYATESANSAVLTAADTIATAADRVQTGLDVTASTASATNAEDWAIKVNGIVDSTGYSAKAWSIGGTGVTDTAGAGPAKDWATETTGQVDGTEYSAKEYAVGSQVGNTTGSAKQWSLGGGTGFDRDTAVTGSGLTAEYSARYWANQAANSAQDFNDQYYGSFTSDTAAEDYQINDNQGSVNVGDLYFDSTNNVMRVRTFSGWQDVAADASDFATNGFAIAMAIAL